MTNEELAWAAGFFDGEGCVRMQIKGCVVTITVSVAQVIPEPLTLLSEWFGGSVIKRSAKRPTHRPAWHWRFAGSKAVDFLRAIRPYCVVKRDQIDLVLDFVRINPTYRARGGGRGRGAVKTVPDNVIALRRGYVEKLSQMKRS